MSKHYTAEKYIEWNVHDPYWRDGLKAETRSEVKTRYRRRERAALKRNLAAEVEVELAEMAEAEAEAAEKAAAEAYKAESISYWLDESIDASEQVEWLRERLEEAEERLRLADFMLSYWEEEE